MAGEGTSRREFDLLAARVERMDLQGTRGVSLLQQQQAQLSRDFGKLEGAVERTETTVQAMQLQMAAAAAARPGKGAWARDLALMVPMYALVIDLIVRGRG